MKEMEHENRELKCANEIIKSAATFFGLLRSELDAVEFPAAIMHILDPQRQFLESVGRKAREKRIGIVRGDSAVSEQLPLPGFDSADRLRIVTPFLSLGVLRREPLILGDAPFYSFPERGAL